MAADRRAQVRPTVERHNAAVYAAWNQDTQLFKGHDDARALADPLVVVRFQRLLQAGLALVKHNVPLLATAHDGWDNFLVEIKPQPSR